MRIHALWLLAVSSLISLTSCAAGTSSASLEKGPVNQEAKTSDKAPVRAQDTNEAKLKIDLRLANALFGTNDYEGALAELNRQISIDPKSAEAMCLRGMCHMALRRYEEALQDFNTVVTLAPDKSPGFVNRASIWIRLGKVTKAEADYGMAIEVDPKCHVAYAERAKLRANQDDYVASMRDISRAIELEPGLFDYWHCRAVFSYNRKSFRSAISDLIQAVNVAPDDASVEKARDLLVSSMGSLAYEQLNTGDCKEAVRLCSDALKLNPKDEVAAVLYENRAAAYLKSAELRKSLDDWTALIRIKPGYGKAFIARASVRYMLGDQRGARADLDSAISIDPKNGEIYYVRGYQSFESEDFAGAAKDYARAVVLKFESAEFCMHRGHLKYLEGEFTEAIAEWKRAVELKPSLGKSLKPFVTAAQQPTRIHDERDPKGAGDTVFVDVSSEVVVDKKKKMIDSRGYYHIRKPCSLLNPKEHLILKSVGEALKGKGGWTYIAKPCPKCLGR